MKTIILWVLILPGPRPYQLGVFESHAQCTQEKYNYGRGDTGTYKERRRNAPICRPRFTSSRGVTNVPD